MSPMSQMVQAPSIGRQVGGDGRSEGLGGTDHIIHAANAHAVATLGAAAARANAATGTKPKKTQPSKQHRIYAKSVYKGVCGKSLGTWTWRYGACNGETRQEKHSYETAKAAAEAYDVYVIGRVSGEKVFRQKMMKKQLNFCLQCGMFRNPKKVEGTMLEALCGCSPDGGAGIGATKVK